MDPTDALINTIWDSFDQDGNGYLDRKETRNFMRQYMKQQGFDDDFEQHTLDMMFIQFD